MSTLATLTDLTAAINTAEGELQTAWAARDGAAAAAVRARLNALWAKRRLALAATQAAHRGSLWDWQPPPPRRP
jgi:hypothetical protein